MRSRTAAEIQRHVKNLLTCIQREYAEKMAKQTSNSTNISLANDSKANETIDEGEANEGKKERKSKRKSWTPVVRFTIPSGDVSPGKENLPMASSSGASTINQKTVERKKHILSAKDVMEID